MSKITVIELARHDGRENHPSYVAVNGDVYDLSDSSLWENGKHMNLHQAGHDLTESLASAPHGREVLEAFKKVGELELQAVRSEPVSKHEIPRWALMMVSLHSHPIFAHFPQALFVFAPIYLALFYILKEPGFERTAYHIMGAGFLSAIPATATGFIHWLYKFGGRSRPVFKLKIILSLVLLPLSGTTFAIHNAYGPLPPYGVYWGILILYCAMLPIIILIGRAGGMIVFDGKGK